MAFGLLTCLFYYPIALTDEILVNYDLLTYFYPYKDYIAETLKQGRFPLWNPYLFMGVPLLANIQTAVFYPLNLLLIWLDAPHAVNASILLHIFLAGLFMYLLAMHGVGLRPRGAFLSGVVFMFSGCLSQQVGHINQLNVSAWLPALVLCYLLSTRRQSLGWALLGGLVAGLQVTAGHPQALFLSLTGLVVFAFFQTKQTLQSRQDLGRQVWMSYWQAWWPFLLILALGLGLSSVQLWPTWELSTQSIRAGGMSYEEAVSFSLPPPELLRSLLPTFSNPPLAEYIAYVGVIPLILGAWTVWRWHHYPPVTISLTLVLGGLFLAFGGYNPLYEGLYRVVPGLDLFRVPARWLFLYTFGVSLVAGIGFDRLLCAAPLEPEGRRAKKNQGWFRKRWGLWLMAGIFFLLLLALVTSRDVWLNVAKGERWLILPDPPVLVAWVGLGALAAVLIRWRERLSRFPTAWSLMFLLVVAELFAAGQALEYKRTVPAQAYTSQRPVLSQLVLDQSPYRILSVASSHFDPGDLPELKELLGRRFSPEATADHITTLKLKEILTPNLPLIYSIATVDGYDGGVLPLKRYVEFKRLLLDSGGRAQAEASDQPDALLRTQLVGIPDASMLGALNVKYVIDDKTHDPWIDNVYYDLEFRIEVTQDRPLVLRRLPSFQATALGVISYLEGATGVVQGTPVGRVTVRDGQGRTESYELMAGQDTSEGRYDEAESPRHGKGRIAIAWKGNPRAYHYYAKLPLSKPTMPVEVRVQSLLPVGRLFITGMSLFDDRTCGPKCASESVVIEQSFQLVNSGDLKLYENLAWRPRLYLVHQYVVESQPERGLALLKSLMNEVAVLAQAPSESVTVSAGEGQGDDVLDITHFAPEKVEAKVQTTSPGLLIFTDAYYPGWRAWVDGEETEVLRANHLFKAVAVPAGEHVVRFEYRPRSLFIGAVVSIATVLTIMGLGVFWGARQWRCHGSSARG